MWVYTLIATVLGSVGTGLSVYNVWYSRREPVRRKQAELRAALDDRLDHIAATMDKPRRLLETRVSAQNLGPELMHEADQLDKLARLLLAPTPDEVGTISRQLRAVAVLWDGLPDGDALADVRLNAKGQMDVAVRAIEAARTGLLKIEQGALRHKRQFKELRP
ncbi:hypothetical protein L2K20_13945 [Mycobacterium sp. MBM]|nr:hypothetical protein [Mycobacterium sp. MBM]